MYGLTVTTIIRYIIILKVRIVLEGEISPLILREELSDTCTTLMIQSVARIAVCQDATW